MEPKRPNPDDLLKNVQEEEDRRKRARLKVFFGMAPGVGKTFAMLQDAQVRLMEGVDVLADEPPAAGLLRIFLKSIYENNIFQHHQLRRTIEER